LIDRLHYFGGYLRIRVWGFSPERFMNLCSSRGILLWNIVKDGEEYYINIGLKDFYRLRPIARKTGVRVAVLKRYGLPFFAPTAHRHRFFIVGIIAAFAFWIISSQFIWNIELNGNLNITNDEIYDYLKEENINIGMLKYKLDISQMEKKLRNRFDDITWISAKINGIRLRIDIKENDAYVISDTNANDDAASSIEAEYDGTIVSIIVRNGVPCVQAGDEVEQGTILVDGAIPIYNDDATLRSYEFTKADADIVMEHQLTFKDVLPFEYTAQVYTGREDADFFLRLGKKELKLPAKSPYLVYDSVETLSRPTVFEKLEIPVYAGVCRYREYMNVEYRYTLDEAKELLNEKINAFIYSLVEKGVQIIEKNVKMDTDASGWTIEGEFTVREKIGKSIIIDTNELNKTLGEIIPDG
jgi:similar to stage IV sporulation protein